MVIFSNTKWWGENRIPLEELGTMCGKSSENTGPIAKEQLDYRNKHYVVSTILIDPHCNYYYHFSHFRNKDYIATNWLGVRGLAK